MFSYFLIPSNPLKWNPFCKLINVQYSLDQYKYFSNSPPFSHEIVRSGYSFDIIKKIFISMKNSIIHLKWEVFINCLLLYICYTLKSPIIAAIYSLNNSYLINVILALFVSYLLSYPIKKWYSHLKNKIPGFRHFLDTIIVEDFIKVMEWLKTGLYYYEAFDGVATAMGAYFQSKTPYGKCRDKLINSGKDIGKIIRTLEPVSSAMERENSDRIHIPLSHVFREHTNDQKKALDDLHTEMKDLKRKYNKTDPDVHVFQWEAESAGHWVNSDGLYLVPSRWPCYGSYLIKQSNFIWGDIIKIKIDLC